MFGLKARAQLVGHVEAPSCWLWSLQPSHAGVVLFHSDWTVNCCGQALAAICRHVAVEVVTAAERDSLDARPSTAPADTSVTEQQLPGEAAHLQRRGRDTAAVVCACQATPAWWLHSGDSLGHGRREDRSPSNGHHTPALMCGPAAAESGADGAMAANMIPASSLDERDAVQHSTVSNRCVPNTHKPACPTSLGAAPCMLSATELQGIQSAYNKQSASGHSHGAAAMLAAAFPAL